MTYGTHSWAFSSWAQLALSQAGMGNREDGFTNGGLHGNAYLLMTIDATAFTRESSETSYLQQLGLQNPNLIIYPSTLGKRILFDSDKRATGVEVDFGGLPLTLYARNEVIISGGAIQSPQMLMVSGIGPKATLDKFGIPVVADLAGVGKNMWDHVRGGISYRVNVETNARAGSDPAFREYAFDQYLSDPPRGPLTSFASDLYAFEKLPEPYRSKLSNATLQSLHQFADDWPELEYFTNSDIMVPNRDTLVVPMALTMGLSWSDLLLLSRAAT